MYWVYFYINFSGKLSVGASITWQKLDLILFMQVKELVILLISIIKQSGKATKEQILGSKEREETTLVKVWVGFCTLQKQNTCI